MTYSNAHAELRRLEQASLVRCKVLGSVHLFEANKDHALAAEFGKLVQASTPTQRPKKQDQAVQQQLSAQQAEIQRQNQELQQLKQQQQR